MWGLPWGFILLLPLSWLLFRNKGRQLAKDLKISRRGLLWYIFFLLLGGFITLSAGPIYLNLGGLVMLGFALRLLYFCETKERWRALLAAIGSGPFCFAFQAGWLWWLARLPFPSEWLLPFFGGLLGAVLALYPAATAGGLILGLLSGNGAALLYLNAGIIASEIGSVACLNTIILALLVALSASRLLRYLQETPPKQAANNRRLT